MPNLDFTPKYDWKTLRPQVEALRAEGLSWALVGQRIGVPEPALYAACRPKKPKPKPEQVPNQAPTRQDDKAEPDKEGSNPPQGLELARTQARKLISDAVSGRADPSAQQIAAARMLLKDELEPKQDGNAFSGIPTEELAERALVLAVSVLGLVRVAALIRERAKERTLDLGLGWTPAGMKDEDGDARDEGATPAPVADSPNALAADTGPRLSAGPSALVVPDTETEGLGEGLPQGPRP